VLESIELIVVTSLSAIEMGIVAEAVSAPFLMVQKEEGRENVLVEIVLKKC